MTRPRPAAVLAVLAALVGLLAALWRPLAPPLPEVQVPQERFAPEVLQTVVEYGQPRLVVALVLAALAVLVPVGLLAAPGVRRRVDELAQRRSAPFAAAAVGAGVVLVTRLATLLPQFWVGHVREVDWGFRTASGVTWLREWLLQVGFEVALAALAVVLFGVLVRARPGDWHWWMVLAATALSAVLVLATPLVFDPLFLDTRPLGPGPTRDRVEEVLDAAGVEAEILVGDASRRTTRVNAYVTGLGPTRRVVLWDNLLDRPDDEVAIVVAHELAHRVHRDLPRGVALTALGVLPFAVVLRRLLDDRRVRDLVGVRDDGPRGAGDPRMVLVLGVAIAVAQAVATPSAMWASRRAEAAADHVAVQWSGEADPLVRTFRGFVVRDLSRPQPPAVATLLFGTHPSIDRRIRAAVVEAERLGLPVPDLAELQEAERPEHHPRIDHPAETPSGAGDG